WRVLRKNISKFIHLRKFEKFSQKECVYKLKISKYPLLSNKYCGDTTRHAILQCWIHWFFACIVSPLVQANFYVTESEHGKQEVLYFRKSTWEKLITEAKCMKNGMYRELDHALTGKIVKNRSFGFSRARLRPKQSGFRMLTNLQAPSRMRVDPVSRLQSGQKSVNSVLQDLHVVIKGLRTKEPEKLGSSVFDYNDVYRKLVPFLYLLRHGSSEVMPSVYIVVSDVSKAFDSVNQGKLLSVMKDVVLDDVYTLEKFTQVICTKKALKVHQHTALACHDIIATSAKINHRLPAQTLDCVLIKKELSRNITKDEIILILKEHITRNVVQLHSNFFLQNVGIPQGSVLSSLLCSYYYGHMERNVIFPFLERATEDLLGKFNTSAEKVVASGPVYLLLRFIDDFIFISTSKTQASMFFSRLARGVRDYNCCMNEEKYGVNFDLNNEQECRSNRLHVGKDGGSYLRWSGLLVNCSTLEIQGDYTRYLNSHLSSTLTVSCRGKVGSQLKAKLRCYLRPKCHPIFYDSKINSPRVVRLNIYQVFLLCAMKFICYIKNLSTLPSFSPKFYFNAIDSSLRYMNRLIKRKMYSFDIEPAFRPKYDVKKKDVIWLGLYAYSRVVEKKQSRYKELLRLLRSKLKGYGKVKNMSSELKYAVDDAHSSVLWSIKY
ncbi:telomerase reverse transcriptase, partial [Phtheirospermum japonicum]